MAILSLIADAAAVLAASSFSRSDSTAYNRAISDEDSPARHQPVRLNTRLTFWARQTPHSRGISQEDRHL